MEGTLWKWTNYFSGWQSRWFILDNGILSYYKSADDVNNGCKGSIKMAVCDVIVHSADNTRLDLIIPGEAHFYVKAATPHERQQWLVALGSCKACLSEGSTAGRLSSQDEIPVDELKSKKSELRLYCDLLMQQVYSVKSAVQETPVPNIEKLDEATLLLSATCDTFINALEDCVKLANASVSLEGAASTHSSNNSDSVVPPSPNRRSAGTRSQPFSWSSGAPSIQRSMSVDRTLPCQQDIPKEDGASVSS
ncbi:Pleckstrin homology domain-containing family A member 3 [Lamellibrachia satsuma]|nr:Pleckstrin homology domain-containing family A member 3 [Lamellibrachia satsuma]